MKLTWTATYDQSCVKVGTLATPITEPTTTTPTTVAAAATPTTVAPAAELPRTGSSSGPFAAVGAVTVLAGAALLGCARKRRSNSI